VGVAVFIARMVAVVAVLSIAIALLPNASSYDSSTLTIPDVIWNPIVAVLGLNRYFPIQELLTVATVAIGIQAAFVGVWLYGWLSRHVFGGG